MSVRSNSELLTIAFTNHHFSVIKDKHLQSQYFAEKQANEPAGQKVGNA